MRGRHQKRAAGATAISLILHGLFLAAMVYGVRAVKLPVESPPIEIRLLPALLEPPPVKAPAAPPRAQPHAAPRPVAQPRPPVPQPAPPPPVALPPAPGPAVPPVASGDGVPRKGLFPSLTGHLGCDDPASFHLTDAQRAVCDQRLAEVAKTTKPIVLNMELDKKAELDRKARCQAIGKNGGAMPSLHGTFALNDSTGGQIAGLGYNPSFRECGPGDR